MFLFSHVSNHHIFFEAKPKVPNQILPPKLIIEMANISLDIKGNRPYVLNLQLSPISNTDAVPCRPLLFPIEKINTWTHSLESNVDKLILLAIAGGAFFSYVYYYRR